MKITMMRGGREMVATGEARNAVLLQEPTMGTRIGTKARVAIRGGMVGTTVIEDGVRVLAEVAGIGIEMTKDRSFVCIQAFKRDGSGLP